VGWDSRSYSSGVNVYIQAQAQARRDRYPDLGWGRETDKFMCVRAVHAPVLPPPSPVGEGCSGGCSPLLPLAFHTSLIMVVVMVVVGGSSGKREIPFSMRGYMDEEG
jgi:hypothetical protein